jgi:hypothetical protein
VSGSTAAPSFCVALVKWAAHAGAEAGMRDELQALGHTAFYFRFDEPIPATADIVFSSGPRRQFLPIPRRIAALPPGRRPIFIHWNTEGMPDPHIPWPIMTGVADLRSWIGRIDDAGRPWQGRLMKTPPLAWVNRHFKRFAYVGDYRYAYRHGWLDVFVEVSDIYARAHSAHGLPAIFAPWGSFHGWHADLDLTRDIDVLWMGKRRNHYRSRQIDQLRSRLEHCGYKMYVADNVENHFIWGDERTRMLNRAKITLNLLTMWSDDTLDYRFPLAAGNRSLVVSETCLPHCPYYQPGTHYVSASPRDLADTIIYYLEHDDERTRIVEEAYRLATHKITLRNSLRVIMAAATEAHARRNRLPLNFLAHNEASLI